MKLYNTLVCNIYRHLLNAAKPIAKHPLQRSSPVQPMPGNGQCDHILTKIGNCQTREEECTFAAIVQKELCTVTKVDDTNQKLVFNGGQKLSASAPP